MKWSKTHLYTIKEAPNDAEVMSHKLLVRAGMIKKLAPGIYTYGHFLLRAMRKFEQIIREELDRRGCTEVLMPMVQPSSLWEESGRWPDMTEMLKFKNRADQEFCLGPTHEEVTTDYVRHDLKSYRDLPKIIYQIQTKYRDEIRPRFGLMRGREFVMKDAYSFDLDKESALKSYELLYEAYQAIFNRVGFEFRIVEADTGNMGGNQSHEFQVLAESGEDHLMVSDGDDYAANIEVAPAIDPEPHVSTETEEREKEKFATPKLRTITDLSKATGVAERELVKTMFFSASDATDELKPVAVLLRGSDEVNPIKLKSVLGLTNPPELLTDKEVREITGALPGSCGPVGLTIPIYMDNGVKGLKNYIVGANEDDFHIKNVNHPRDFKVTATIDCRMAKEGDKSPGGQGYLKSVRGVEVGHVFYLGQKYSKSMNVSYLDEKGEANTVEMGSYGIGVSRTIQAAVEQCHDKDGIVWPVSIAPFHVHLCCLDADDEEVLGVSEKLYNDLWKLGIEVFMDDRTERPGVKFKDADLLGSPLRLTVGKRGLKEGVVELVERQTKNMSKLSPAEAMDKVEQWLKEFQ